MSRLDSLKAAFAHRLGTVTYFRGKGQSWVEMIRSWVTPAAAGGFYSKYLGLSGRWSIVVAILIPVVVEGFGYLLGRFLYKHGGVAVDYDLAWKRDGYKLTHIATLERIESALGAALEAQKIVLDRLERTGVSFPVKEESHDPGRGDCAIE